MEELEFHEKRLQQLRRQCYALAKTRRLCLLYLELHAVSLHPLPEWAPNRPEWVY